MAIPSALVSVLLCSGALAAQAARAQPWRPVGDPPHHECLERTPPLFEAIDAKDLAQVRRLIRQGADVNTPCDFGEGGMATPLDEAFGMQTKEIVLALLDAGANPSSVRGSPALTRAIELGWDEVVERLNRSGASGAAEGAQLRAGDVEAAKAVDGVPPTPSRPPRTPPSRPLEAAPDRRETLRGLGASLEGGWGSSGAAGAVELNVARARTHWLTGDVTELAAGYSFSRGALRLRSSFGFHLATLGLQAGASVHLPAADWREGTALSLGAGVLIPELAGRPWMAGSVHLEVGLDGRASAVLRISSWYDFR